MYQNLKARDPEEREKVLHRRKDYFGASTVHLYNEEGMSCLYMHLFFIFIRIL